MQAGNVIRVRSVSTVDFIAAMAHGGGAQVASLTPPMAIGAGGHCRSRLHEIRLITSKRIQFGVQLWASAAAARIGGTDIDSDGYLGEWVFGNSGQPGDGDQATGDTFFYYYINGMDQCYQDADNLGKIHIRLVNWDAAVDKLSHAGGDNVVVELALEPLQGI